MGRGKKEDGDILDNPPRDLAAEFFRDGADEFALLSFPLTPAAISPTVAARLTAAEQEVVAQVLAGASSHRIARARSTSPHTVTNQLASIFRKLGVGSRWELVAHCHQTSGG